MQSGLAAFVAYLSKIVVPPVAFFVIVLIRTNVDALAVFLIPTAVNPRIFVFFLFSRPLSRSPSLTRSPSLPPPPR